MNASRLSVVAACCFLAQACVTESSTGQRVASDDDAAVANMNLGAGYLRQGRADLAIDALERAIELNPRLADAHSTIAIAYDQRGDNTLAEQHYRRATSLEPGNAAAANSYAVFLCRQDRWPDAEDYFRRAAETPRYATPEAALANAGVCASNAGDNAKAEEYLRAALDKNPEYPDALSSMIELSYREQEYMQARAFMQRYLDVRPAERVRVVVVLQHRTGARQSGRPPSVVPLSFARVSRSPRRSLSFKSCKDAMDATEPNKADGDNSGQAPSLGQVLKAGRAARGLTLEQMSTELRIELQQLRALEQDEFERIGPPVFVKGYLRHFGQRVGLDYGDLLSLYYKQAEKRDILVQPSRPIMLRDERQITVWIVAAVLLVAVMAALAVWWWMSSGAAPVAGSATPAAAAPRREPLQPADAASREAEPAPVAAASKPAAEAPDSSGPTLQSPRAGPAPPSAPADTPSPAADGGDSAIAAGATLLEFTLDFAQESWVEISDAHGGRLFYGLGRAGRRAALAGEPPILVLIGNAEGVQLTMNGADYPIPRGRQGNLARFTLTAPD